MSVSRPASRSAEPPADEHHGGPPVVVSGPELMFGVGAVAWSRGEMRGSMPVEPTSTGDDGRTAVGALGVLVDDVLGYAIIDSLPPGSWSVSTEIWIDLLAPLPGDGRIHASARTVQAGSFSAGVVVDSVGRPLALCRERGRQIDDVPSPLPGTDLGAWPGAGVGGNLGELIGLRASGDSLVLQVQPHLGNPRGMLHGGISLAASEVAATRSRLTAGSDLATTSVHIAHTRPVPPAAEVEFRATTVHAGRSLWLTDVTGLVDGKVCTTARVTAQVSG